MLIDPHNRHANILTRHLHRHTQVSTLFRSVEPDSPVRTAAHTGVGISPDLSPGQTVHARLAAFEPDQVLSDLTRDEQGIVEEMPARQPSPLPPVSLPIETGRAAAEPASMNDLAWRRLEAIHQEQHEAVEAASSSPARSPIPPVQRQPAAPAEQGIHTKPQPGRIETAQPARQPSIRPASPAEPRRDSKITDADWRRLEAISRAHAAKDQSEAAEAQQTTGPTPDTGAALQKTPAARAESGFDLPRPTSSGEPKLAAGEKLGPAGEPSDKAALSRLPTHKIEELSPDRIQPKPVEQSSTPTSAEHETSRVQRAWQQLQNIFGWRPESEQAEPGAPAETKASSTPESTSGSQPRAAQVSQPGSELPISLSENTAAEIVEVEPPEPEAEVYPARMADNSLVQPSAEGQAPGLEEGVDTSTTREAEMTSPLQGQTAVVQPKASDRPEQMQDAQSWQASNAQPGEASVAAKEPSASAKPGYEENIETEMVAGRPDEIERQALPLEAVWPVERIGRVPEEPIQRAETTPPRGSALLAEIPAKETGELHRLLDGIQPGQPTGSKVELIAPRRPRPPVPPAETVATTEVSSIPAGETEALQRAAEISPLSPETVVPSSAPGAMNPELAELWGLFDEMRSDRSKPAGSTPAAEPQRPGPGASFNRDIQKAELPAQPAAGPVSNQAGPSPSPVEAFQKGLPEETLLVQRQVATAAQPDQTAGQAGKPDIDELARQVYAEVRRKLALEWERLRR